MKRGLVPKAGEPKLANQRGSQISSFLASLAGVFGPFYFFLLIVSHYLPYSVSLITTKFSQVCITIFCAVRTKAWYPYRGTLADRLSDISALM